jgi:hypothetical protein
MFYLQGSQKIRKIRKISWDTICLYKENGGFGVHIIREFNMIFSEKWCWRMQVAKDSLWSRVCAGRYGMVGGMVCDGGANCICLGWFVGLIIIWCGRWEIGIKHFLGMCVCGRYVGYDFG